MAFLVPSPHPSTAACRLAPPFPLRRPPSSLRLRPFRRYSSANKDGTSFTDQILDYIEGGPKLRRWYGAPDPLPRDGTVDEDEGWSPEDDEYRNAVLVTDGDSEIGQMVILSLILKRVQIKAIVKDKRAAVDAFGTYVEPVAADESGRLSLMKALKGVRAIICPNEGFLSDIGQMKGIQHIVLLSQLAAYRSSSGIQALMNGKARKLAERDEESVIASGIPYTIIRCGLLQDNPGRKEGFSFKEGVAAKGKLSKEDAACVCVEALDVIPRKGLIVEVANGEEKILDWKQWFASMVENEGLLQ